VLVADDQIRYAGQARVFTLELPGRTEWMTSNDHKGGYGRRMRLTEEMLGEARWAARAARLPALERARIVFAYCPPKYRRLDPGNWYPSAKAYVDGLVAEGVLPDDDTFHLIGPEARLGDPYPPCGRMVLRIAELPPLTVFDCESPKAAAAVAAHAREITPPGIDMDHRARASGKTVTVMWSDPWYPSELIMWAYQEGHVNDLTGMPPLTAATPTPRR
jgi:hypothetical protein